MATASFHNFRPPTYTAPVNPGNTHRQRPDGPQPTWTRRRAIMAAPYLVEPNLILSQDKYPGLVPDFTDAFFIQVHPDSQFCDTCPACQGINLGHGHK